MTVLRALDVLKGVGDFIGKLARGAVTNESAVKPEYHTFGVLMLNEDIPIGSIAKMMGHADITSTQVYAQVTEQKISNDMDKLIAKRERNRLSNEKTIGK